VLTVIDSNALTQILAKDENHLKISKEAIGADTATMLRNINAGLKAQGLKEATGMTSSDSKKDAGKDSGISGSALSSPAWALIFTAHVLVMGLLG
jgi:hypothetical protein